MSAATAAAITTDALCGRCPSDYRSLDAHGYNAHPMSDWAERRQCSSTGHIALYALRAFEAGDVLCEFGARSEKSHPTYLTVQVGEGRHIELQPEWLQHINHSCAPNAMFNTTAFHLEALRNIAEGEELSVFYPSMEWAMASPFTCKCGTPGCLRVIAGASQLGAAALEGRRLTDFIASKLLQQEAATAAAAAAGAPTA